jgi:putative oxygen-independent coproporphyrinogen III oxidase
MAPSEFRLTDKYTSAEQKDLSIYVHWPFCVSKCPYCDFNSHVERSVEPSSWSKAIGNQIAEGANLLGRRSITSIFFGGGTPSLMRPQIVAEVINHIEKQWHISENAEISLEANPNSSEATKFADFLKAGVNRLSLGVQSLDNRNLQFLGRQHSADEAIRAAETAREIFPRSSIDLIYSLPGQTIDKWQKELTEALKITGDHISLYQLTVEKGTPFYAMQRNGNLKLPRDSKAIQLYKLTQDMLKASGFPRYEISNHAQPGGESCHNLTYWLYKDYLGVGPGAHSRITLDNKVYALAQIPSPAKWLEENKTGTSIDARSEVLSLLQCVREMVMMGLRLTGGINKKRFEDRLNHSLNDVLDPNVLASLKERGLVLDNALNLQLTSCGHTLINPILERLLP